MGERLIARRDVRWLLARGIREETRTSGGPQRWLAHGTSGDRRLGVAFIESASAILVLTVLDFDR
jgi:hypothetical protein